MTRLDYAALAALPRDVVRPDRPAPPRVGIVHFGPGAFHRAHQAAYIDRLLDDDPRWGIAAVALRSADTVAGLAAQQGLYTIAVRDAVPGWRVVGAHGAWLGPGDGDAVRALLASPAVSLVTSTITEKGYCLAADGTLDRAHPDIAADLANPAVVPRSFVGWLVAGLRARRAAGLAPFTVMPCDNLADNGGKLRRAVLAFAQEGDRALAQWLDDRLTVPSTMVDSITPASDAALLADTAAALGVADAIPVQRERFVQWVVEDRGQGGPDLAAAGAILTRDVAGYERAKLRILNGAHSTLAYHGLLRGHTTVAEAMADPELAGTIARLIDEDIAPLLPPVAGLDLTDYGRAVRTRFANPAIAHRLDQIAQDGSQKLPYRLGDTLLAALAAGRAVPHVLGGYAAWIAFVTMRARRGVALIDPAADDLMSLGGSLAPRDLVAALADRAIGLPPAVARHDVTLNAIADAAEALLAVAACQ